MFSVTSGGDVTPESNDGESAPEPTAEDRRKANLLAAGGRFAPDVEDLFARGIAVARSGGDVREFLRTQLRESESPSPRVDDE